MRADVRYRAAVAHDLVRVEFDELTAVFDRRSGQTHLLASPLPEMLEALGAEEWTLTAFAAQLASEYDMTGEGEAAARIDQRLAELVALGLVEAR